MNVGDLVIEKTRMSRKPSMGVVLKVDHEQYIPTRGATAAPMPCPYLIHFFDDDEHTWMREGFLEVISENR
jgi:hypothetical protein